jgi:hypothetical protein
MPYDPPRRRLLKQLELAIFRIVISMNPTGYLSIKNAMIGRQFFRILCAPTERRALRSNLIAMRVAHA